MAVKGFMLYGPFTKTDNIKKINSEAEWKCMAIRSQFMKILFNDTEIVWSILESTDDINSALFRPLYVSL